MKEKIKLKVTYAVNQVYDEINHSKLTTCDLRKSKYTGAAISTGYQNTLFPIYMQAEKVDLTSPQKR